MNVKIKKGALIGMGITGLTGGFIGFFLGQPIYMIGMATVAALLGFVIWSFGGQRFFAFVAIGALLGGVLAAYLSTVQWSLLGAATGGAVGGFLGVNIALFKHK